ncbi:hypothetical protein OQA88_13459 [Cercophora sp. LCS_1]
MMEMLLFRADVDITLTEETVAAMAHHSSSRSMVLFLARFKQRVVITSSVLAGAARNRDPSAMIQIVLDHADGEDVEVTQEVLEAVAGQILGVQGLLVMLVDRYGLESLFNSGLVEAVASHGMPDLMKHLIKQCPDLVQITDRVVEAAARNPTGYMLGYILASKRGRKLGISQGTVTTAVATGADVLKVLLNKRGSEVQITEDLVCIAAGHETDSVASMELLLERRPRDVEIALRVAAAAACNTNACLILMQLFLDRRGPTWLATDLITVIKEIPESEYTTRLVEFLLQHVEVERNTTQLLISAAVEIDYPLPEMRFMLDHTLKHNPYGVGKITERVAKAAAGNTEHGSELFSLFVEHRKKVKVTEEVVQRAAMNESLGDRIIDSMMRGGLITLGMLESGRVEDAARVNKTSGARILEVLNESREDVIKRGSRLGF